MKNSLGDRELVFEIEPISVYSPTGRIRRWHFRIVAGNGEIIGGSAGEDYENRIDCINIVKTIQGKAGTSKLRILRKER